ncbi:MAG: two-component regulator propeller domain-containing protein [Chitinophagaceae bacterium]
MNLYKLLSCCTFVLAVCLLKGQQKELNFTSLTTKDGLSSNTVNAILKDSYGIIWFATEDGLDEFDGAHFTVYRHKPGDTTSLSANEVLSLHEDKSGNLWIGTSGGSLCLYNRKKNNFTSVPTGFANNAISSNVIRSICSDSNGKIWVAHFDGVSIFDPVTKLVSPIPAVHISGSSVNTLAMCLFRDSKNQMWMGTMQGLFRYNPFTKTLTQFAHSDTDPYSISDNNVNSVAEDKRGNIWVGTSKGLNKFLPEQQHFFHYNNHDAKEGVKLQPVAINKIAVDGDSLWMGTARGLAILNTKTDALTSIEQDQRNLHSLTAKSLKTVYIDNQGIYWLGTIRGGVDKYDRNLNLFNYVKANPFDENGLNAPIVTAFAEATQGQLYVGTDGGVSLFDPRTRLFQNMPIRSSKNKASIAVVTMAKTSKGKLLVGSASDGLFVVDPVSKKYKQLTAGPGTHQLNSNEIYSITELQNGKLVIGTNGEGINVLNKDYEVELRYTPHPKSNTDIKLPINGYIRDIKEDKNNNIWIATHGGGIAILQPDTRVFTIYNASNSKLSNDKVLSLLKDSRGLMWIATFGGGICVFNDKKGQFEQFSEKEGLQNSTIYKLLEDDKGLVWASSNKGISSIDIQTKKINNYNYYNGIQRNNFVPGAGLKLPGGALFFGGLDGFNYFDPAYLIKNNIVPSVLLTGLRVANQEVVASQHGPITENIVVANEINLSYKQNFALDFVGLNYTTPEQNNYAYKLEGFDKDWNYVGNATSAAYTNIDPGNYTFRVRASNNDGIWNPVGASINVRVHPPFWRTIYAYAFYLLALLGILFYIRFKGIQKINRRFALEQKKMYEEQERRDANRLHELDSLKIKFLTNLSHEFRTPISLILGPVDSLMEQQKDIHSFRQLDMIKRNARRLLNMVNQLLDFRKMEEQELQLHSTQDDVVNFIKEVSDSFIDLAERKKLAFSFTSKIDKLHAYFDHDKIERILFNILSNAFKFTQSGGQILLELSKAMEQPDTSKVWISIKISDNGIGIPSDKKDKIFTLFFQDATHASILNQGSGIGLTITKEFVEMHGGTIKVESEPEKGSSFTIMLPLVPVPMPTIKEQIALNGATDKETAATQIAMQQEEIVSNENSDAIIPAVLLVEDNEDFRAFLKEKLQLHYKVLEAANGKEGWQRALAHHPQLIVSDISMPEMNGTDLCRKLKSDKRTRHIPIILLTAITGENDQLSGLKTGANDYITKPFHVEMLQAKINNLLVLNDALKTTYKKQIKALAPEIAIQSADEELLQRIMLYLEENLSNPDLSVEELSRHVGMSRSSLYNKLLEITGETPVEYIRSVKLDKAAILLARSDMNIAQVAYSVGFSTSNYFAKSFRQKFNMLPSEYAGKMRTAHKKK